MARIEAYQFIMREEGATGSLYVFSVQQPPPLPKGD